MESQRSAARRAIQWAGVRDANRLYARLLVAAPLADSQEWVHGNLAYGEVHQIRGLYEFRQEYGQEQWRVQDEAIAQGTAFGFADYVLFLAYSGIVLSHAFVRLRLTRPDLPVWAFTTEICFFSGGRRRRDSC